MSMIELADLLWSLGATAGLALLTWGAVLALNHGAADVDAIGRNRFALREDLRAGSDDPALRA